VVNIGQGVPVRLMDFVAEIEEAVGRKARCRMMDLQPGDVPATWADTTLLRALAGPLPKTELKDGVRAFVEWYRGYFPPERQE
jgi:UDP-glucuronate 4-epimerase